MQVTTLGDQPLALRRASTRHEASANAVRGLAQRRHHSAVPKWVTPCHEVLLLLMAAYQCALSNAHRYRMSFSAGSGIIRELDPNDWPDCFALPDP